MSSEVVTLNYRVNPLVDMETLVDKIIGLYETDAYHVKRGFPIRGATPIGIGVHLVEEAVEVLDAVVHNSDLYAGGNLTHLTEELADLVLLLAHLTHRHNITFQEVLDVAADKLDRNWTTDPAKITAKEPGFTRRGRA
jgi:NTP pyrophosphatase (non-canonical NTP hydrolase)